jgi:hypothetical protein
VLKDTPSIAPGKIWSIEIVSGAELLKSKLNRDAVYTILHRADTAGSNKALLLTTVTKLECGVNASSGRSNGLENSLDCNT